jgi:hypothetical protein
MGMIRHTYKWGRVALTTGPVAPRELAPGALDTIAIDSWCPPRQSSSLDASQDERSRDHG